MTSTLTNQQIADYRANGYLIIRDVVSSQETSELRSIVPADGPRRSVPILSAIPTHPASTPSAATESPSPDCPPLPSTLRSSMQSKPYLGNPPI